MTRAIPEQIVAAVTELATSLATWCEEGRDGRLEQHEAAVLEREEARDLLQSAGNNVAVALVMAKAKVGRSKAEAALKKSDGHVRKAITAASRA